MSNFVNLLSIVYPVGSVYITFNTISPANIVGGTWELLKNKFLYSSADDTGNIGGEATHLLTVDEIPSHSHGLSTPVIIPWKDSLNQFWNQPQWTTSGPDYYGAANPDKVKVNYTGEGQTHNNMPPYITVHMYRRTA